MQLLIRLCAKFEHAHTLHMITETEEQSQLDKIEKGTESSLLFNSFDINSFISQLICFV